ncbi:MAG: TPM domain-containing protein [Acidobacteria bacterium]|nr:TPM domain-containing protein [Acidobacteriota bacterium]
MSNFRQLRGTLTILVALLLGGLATFGQSATPFSIDVAPIANNGQPVNDYANVIDDAVEQQINQKIKDFMKRTNPPVVLAVATVRTTGDRPIFDYSLAVARGWKIGSKTDDNPSALLFVAIDDRKYQTQVSRDLEDELPDGLAGQLQRQYLIPAFKQGDYTKGINDTIDAYIRTIESRLSGTTTTGQTQPGPTPATTRKSSSPFSTAGICCLIVIILLFVLIFSRRGGRGGGGRWGGGGGGGSALPWIVGSIIANSASRSGGSSSWGGGGSSDWGGGGSSGGGDWGGFGGGGDFGGGGAGGDW